MIKKIYINNNIIIIQAKSIGKRADKQSMGFVFILTTVSIFIYALYSYLCIGFYILPQSIYTLWLIVYLSANPQHKQKFKIYHLPQLTQSLSTTSSCKQKQEKVKGQKQNQNDFNICKICKKIKPPRYYHCRRCNICIYQMDHHCEWLDCCVGQFNFKLYAQTLVNLILLASICILRVIYQFTMKNQEGGYINVSMVLRLVFAGFTLYESLRMFINFVEFVQKNQTLVETYKKVRGEKMNYTEKLEEIFGEKFGMRWFFPIFADGKRCNIYQKVYPSNQNEVKEVIPQYNYADEYMHGPDDENQDIMQKQIDKNL